MKPKTFCVLFLLPDPRKYKVKTVIRFSSQKSLRSSETPETKPISNMHWNILWKISLLLVSPVGVKFTRLLPHKTRSVHWSVHNVWKRLPAICILPEIEACVCDALSYWTIGHRTLKKQQKFICFCLFLCQTVLLSKQPGINEIKMFVGKV